MAEPQSRGPWTDQYISNTEMAVGGGAANLFDLSVLRGLLFRQRLILISVIMVSVVLGLVLTLLTKPIYEASASVRIDTTSADIVEGQDIASLGIRGSQIDRFMNTQGAVIKSRKMAFQVVDMLTLADNPQIFGADQAEKPAGVTDAKWKEQLRKSAASMLSSGISVDIPNDSNIISIKYQSSNPQFAATVSNGYADTFVEEDTRRGLETTTYAQRYLKDQIADIGEKLQKAEMQANAYAKANGIVATTAAPSTGDANSGSTPTITITNLTTVSSNYTEARSRRIAAEQRWKSIAGLPTSQLPEVQGNSTVQSLVGERSKASAQLSELRQRYGVDYPQVVETEAQIKSLDNQIARLSTDIKNSIRDQYMLATRQEAAVSDELKRVSGNTLDEQDRRVRFNILEREAGSLRSQLATMLERSNQVSAAANVKNGEVTKLDDALVPSAPISPNLIKNLSIALIAGIALAVALAVLRDAFDDRLRSAEDVERKLATPVLGFTPFLETEDLTEQAANPFSALMEAYASLRTSVDFALAGDHRVFMVTSSQASEGKTLTSSILARKYAELGHKTLLIDADLRKPSVARVFGENKRPTKGLAEVLLGDVELESALLKQSTQNLSVLSVGAIPTNPVELLSSVRLKDFIDKCRNEYSLIIIDTSPVLGLADAPLVSRLVDGVVFVVEANRSSFGQTKTALRRLRSAGANVIGVVLTKYRAAEAGLAYDYHYSYYAYGESKEK